MLTVSISLTFVNNTDLPIYSSFRAIAFAYQTSDTFRDPKLCCEFDAAIQTSETTVCLEYSSVLSKLQNKFVFALIVLQIACCPLTFSRLTRLMRLV